jgi:hypothetical protein
MWENGKGATAHSESIKLSFSPAQEEGENKTRERERDDELFIAVSLRRDFFLLLLWLCHRYTLRSPILAPISLSQVCTCRRSLSYARILIRKLHWNRTTSAVGCVCFVCTFEEMLLAMMEMTSSERPPEYESWSASHSQSQSFSRKFHSPSRPPSSDFNFKFHLVLPERERAHSFGWIQLSHSLEMTSAGLTLNEPLSYA